MLLKREFVVTQLLQLLGESLPFILELVGVTILLTQLLLQRAYPAFLLDKSVLQ
jgi:hypothetical protein